MKLIIKVHWYIFVIITSVFLAGFTLYRLSSSIVISIKLLPKFENSTSVTRIFHSEFEKFDFWHPTKAAQKRKELGEWENSGVDHKKGELYFRNPGAAVKILAQSDEKKIIYELLPAGGIGEKTIRRGMIPYVNDENPNLFHYPTKDNRFQFSKIKNNLKFSVLEVDSSLLGEECQICIQSPIPFKFEPKGKYKYLWWFHLWPIYTGIIIIYFAILIIITKRNT
jgi:hypothetical protein